MATFTPAALLLKRDHAACNGCGLCLLVCPMWRRHRDLTHTPQGYAKALQHGVRAEELGEALWACSLCGACDPVCPERLDLTGMILALRREVQHDRKSDIQAHLEARIAEPIKAKPAMAKLLPDRALLDHPETLACVLEVLGIAQAEDDGTDIAQALEAGVVIPAERIRSFLAQFKGVQRIVVGDGLLLRHLRQLGGAIHFVSLGEALSSRAAVRAQLRASDLYVIEPHAYHADHARLIAHYDRLRSETGSQFNLDLQHCAIPAAAHSLPQKLDNAPSDDAEQVRWLLHGRKVERIAVECLEHRAVLEKISGVPVVHLAELAEDGGRL